MPGSEEIRDTDEVWPDYAKALEAFKAFRRKRPGGSDLARHRQAMKEIKKTNLAIDTATVQRFVHRQGETFEKNRSSNPSRMQFRNIRQIVAIIAPDQNALDFVDREGVRAAQIRRDHDCKCSKRSRWLPTEPRYLREGWVSFLIAPQADVENLPLDVSVRLSSIYVKIPEGAGTPQLPATVWIKAGEILLRSPTSQPVPETILGGAFQRADLITHDGVRWNFEYPRGANEHQLDKARLCELRLHGAGPHRVELTLRCRDLDLEVEFIDLPPDVDTRSAAILARLIQKMGVREPDADYIALATAGIALEESE